MFSFFFFYLLSTTTTASASDILSGKTAYDNSGNLITGTHEKCVSGSFEKETNTQINIPTGFLPSKFYLFVYNTRGTKRLVVYNSDLDNIVRNYNPTNNQISTTYTINESDFYIDSNKIYTITNSSGWFGGAYTINYTACE